MAAKPAPQEDADAALARKLQAEEDAILAMQHHDEGIAEQHDPWKQAEGEWAKVEANQYVDADAKFAQKLQEEDDKLAQSPAKKS